MPTSRQIYWDSSVFLSLLNGMPSRAPILRDIMAEIESDKDSFILTSSESMVEVAHVADEKTKSRLDPKVEALIDEMWAMDKIVKIIDNGPHIATIARTLVRDGIPHKWTLRPKDAIHLASAHWYNKNVHRIEEVNLYDKALFKYETMVGIHICEPHIQQMRLKNM